MRRTRRAGTLVLSLQPITVQRSSLGTGFIEYLCTITEKLCVELVYIEGQIETNGYINDHEPTVDQKFDPEMINSECNFYAAVCCSRRVTCNKCSDIVEIAHLRP